MIDDEMERLIDRIESLFDAGRMDLVDEILCSAEMRDPAYALTALRTTFAARRELPSWSSTLMIAREEAAIRGLDPDRLFAGLLERVE